MKIPQARVHPSASIDIPDQDTTTHRTIGVLTIGQSPRADRLGADVQDVLGENVQIVERGALDGLSGDQIAGLAPTGDSTYRLITLLRDGRSVQLDKSTILDLLQSQIEDLENHQHVDAILLMCTGAFPPFRHSQPLLMPQQALYGSVIGMADGAKIGALIPLESQREQALLKWSEMGVNQVEVFPASPYGEEPRSALALASAAAWEAGARILFMDCFGYDQSMKNVVRQSFAGPVVLARTLAARFIDELSQ